MKRFAQLVLAGLALGTAACNNDDAHSPTSPVRGPLHSVIFDGAGDPCSEVLHEQSAVERRALFGDIGSTALAEIDIYWQPVDVNCPAGTPTDANLNAAREAMLAYVQHTIVMLRDGKILPPTPDVPPGKNFATREAALVDHWNTMFAFVGYARPNLPPDVLLTGGIAGVIFQNTVNRELRIPSAAALTVPVQNPDSGDVRGHLFSIYKLTGSCLASGNMQQTGPCFKFSANPPVDPRFIPKVKVGICQPVAEGQPIAGAIPALGHEDNGQTLIATPVGVYPTDCIDLVAQGSWTGGLGDIGLKLASIAGRVLGVEPAYAAHGGLGGVSEEFSPFGAVDLLLFKATFTADALDKGPPGPPEVGTWFVDVNKSSEIRVKKELGDLKTKPVVIDYHELKCGGCVGLTLRGIVSSGVTAGNGKYSIKWTSVSQGPDEDAASFVARDGSQREIARVTYGNIKKPKADVLLYNGSNVGTWNKDDKQSFEMIVDLNAKTTSLRINGSLVASGVPFVNNAAANLASIGAEFAGDTKKVGWDDISITRLPDL